MICNRSKDLIFDNSKLELEIDFAQSVTGKIDYRVVSENYINSITDSNSTNSNNITMLKHEDILPEFLFPPNLKKYFSIIKNGTTTEEKLFIPKFNEYLNIRFIPLLDNKAKFILSFAEQLDNASKKCRTDLVKYNHLLENSSDWIAIVDKNGKPIFISPSSKHILGFKEAESLSISPFDLVHQNDLPFVLDKFNQVKREFGKVVRLKCELKKSNNTFIKVEIKAKNCFNIEYINGIIVAINDITNQEIITERIGYKVTSQGNTSQLKLEDLIDLEKINNLMESFYKFYKIPSAIVDLKDNSLTASGLSEICTKFHRKNPLFHSRCVKSNIELTKDLKKNEIRCKKCLNNMYNMASPIYINDRHVANLIFGQFFFTDEEPDYSTFEAQAKQFGVDVEQYLEALDKVPRIDRNRVTHIISLYRELLNIITTIAHSRLKLLESNYNIELREEKLRQITDNMTDVIFTADFDFNINYISPSIEKLTGYTPEEYMQLSMEKRYTPQAIKEIKKNISYELNAKQKLVDNESSNIHTLALLNKQKRIVMTSIHSKLMRDKNDKPIAVIASIRDITEQIKAEKKLEQQLKLQSLLSAIAIKYINIPTKDIDKSLTDSLAQMATFVKADRAYIFEYNWEKQVTSLSYEWTAPGIPPQMDKLQNIPLKYLNIVPQKHKMGQVVNVDDFSTVESYQNIVKLLNLQQSQSSITIPIGDSKQCFGFVGFDSVKFKNFFKKSETTILSIFAQMIVNITNRTNLENDLRTERQKAQTSDNLKSNLLKNISHEFRTPLNGIVGFSELLQQRISDAESKNMANMIYSSAIRLNHVLDSIMLLNQLEDFDNKKSIDLKTTNISNVILEVCSLSKEQFKIKNLSFDYEIQENLYGQSDENLLKQALIHILNNALKFTNKGGVKLLCTSSKRNIIIVVIDSGVGIPNESLKIIFSKFRQVSEGYNRAYEGIGLGLPIAKNIISLMNGEISVKSKLLAGSTFTIKLPLQKVDSSSITNKETDLKSQKTNTALDKPQVLVVEDNSINQKLIVSILKNNFSTDLATNGEVAIRLAQKKKYDTILMDIHLGDGIDGLAATEIIRKNAMNATTPVIAVTGYTMIGDKERILEGGCNYYLRKPYKKTELLNVIDRAISSY